MTSPANPRHPGAGALPVIAPQGEFDYGTVPQLQEQIDTAVNERGGVILDAGGITFIDSTVLTLILMTHQRTHLRIANLPPLEPPSPQQPDQGSRRPDGEWLGPS
ncbi:STAS domain-containing protein [Streptomyces microflavus]|uniref:STAS domain-containing protein n=1 Tax=Streptomyces microflavus TaxID=1919 RepID=UPI003318D99D